MAILSHWNPDLLSHSGESRNDDRAELLREILESPDNKAKMVNHNYEIATRYYSVLKKWLNSLIINFFGIEI